MASVEPLSPRLLSVPMKTPSWTASKRRAKASARRSEVWFVSAPGVAASASPTDNGFRISCQSLRGSPQALIPS